MKKMKTTQPKRYAIKVNHEARPTFTLVDKKRDRTVGEYPTLMKALNALDFMREGGVRFGH
jgi:hypothetical protein